MDIESAMRDKLTDDWGVDFSDSRQTPWSNIHSHADGYMSMAALQVNGEGRDATIRIYRAFPTGGNIAVSVDIETSAPQFASAVRETFTYDNGKRGDFSEWKKAIRDEVGGDVVLLWANDESPLFSFVARTVKVGGAERVICGQSEITPAGIVTQIDYDAPISDMVKTPSADSKSTPLTFP